MTEASTQQNFNFGFTTYKSEILVHLSQWQYWWWFWFGAWWALYYFIILRIVTKKTFNFNVTINTSIRGRGKWGDFLVALIPVSWCCNILINSNFILRMIEWQNEASLFTVRIQGKQWYWVYKYDPSTTQGIITIPKNVGHDKWRVTTGIDSYGADTYYQAIHLAAQIEFNDSYIKFTKKNENTKSVLHTNTLSNEVSMSTTQWDNINVKNTTYNYPKQKEYVMNISNLKNFKKSSNFGIIKEHIDDNNDLNITSHKDVLSSSKHSKTELSENLYTECSVGSSKPKVHYTILYRNDPDYNFYNDCIQLDDNNNLNIKSYKDVLYSPKYRGIELSENLYIEYLEGNGPSQLQYKNLYCNDSNYNSYYDYIQLDETSDVNSNMRNIQSTQPFRVVKGILNQHNLDIIGNSYKSKVKLTKLLFFNYKLTNSGESLKDKDLHSENFWGFRQKKYKRIKKYSLKHEFTYDPNTFKILSKKKMPVSSKLDIVGVDLLDFNPLNSGVLDNNNAVFDEKEIDYTDNINYRVAVKINRHRSELVPVTLARRLLRTKRTLVLPAHINLTIITNSYDVVHSWFVPGMGLKIDCVPGRSTHHTFYIDNIGFYYGQCAEICGRYHHHMPIRLCALPFEQFIVWWQSKGLPRLNRLSEIKKSKINGINLVNDISASKLIYRSY